MTDSKKKILLIDDDPAVGDALWMLLKDEFDTHAATTVRDGVRLFDALHPNLVLLDLHLPDNPGLEALRAIREKSRSAPVVILTGYATLEAVEESMRLGASDCLHKPFDAEALKSRLRELVVDKDSEEERPVLSDLQTYLRDEGVNPEKLVSSSFLHDVSNPLTSLLTYSSILQDELEKLPKANRIARLMHENLLYLASLTDQWRAFAEPATLPRDFASLGDIAARACDLVKLRAETKGVEIESDVVDATATPQLNRHAVVRILVNLLQNAIEAVDSGSGRVRLRARLVDSNCEFVVQDNGKGIAAESMREIFKPRYTTKKKGTGLGLYIASNILESANGAISICSHTGKGTSFTVQLPKA